MKKLGVIILTGLLWGSFPTIAAYADHDGGCWEGECYDGRGGDGGESGGHQGYGGGGGRSGDMEQGDGRNCRNFCDNIIYIPDPRGGGSGEEGGRYE